MVSRFIPPALRNDEVSAESQLTAGLEPWRAFYRPHEASAVAVKRFLSEGCVLPTLQTVEAGGTKRSVVYVRWGNFQPFGSDAERKLAAVESLAFMLERYHATGVRDLMFVYDYTKWGPSQSEPSALAEVANMVGRYGFNARHCIVDAPAVFTPLWLVIKAILPSHLLNAVEFIGHKQLPDGVTYEAARASSAAWLTSVEPLLQPETSPFVSRLAALQKQARAAPPAAPHSLLKAGGNNLLSRGSGSYQTRHFYILGEGGGGPLALGFSGSFGGEFKRVYSLDGARCSDAELDATARESSSWGTRRSVADVHAFRLEFADGQVLNLAARTAEEKDAFVEACGIAEGGD